MPSWYQWHLITTVYQSLQSKYSKRYNINLPQFITQTTKNKKITAEKVTICVDYVTKVTWLFV